MQSLSRPGYADSMAKLDQPAHLASTRSGKGWAGVLILLAAATGVGMALDRQVSLTSQAMVYVLAVVIAAHRLHWTQSVACAVGATTALNFFFVPPRWTFQVDSREHLFALAAMLLVALVISRLAASLRAESASAGRYARRAQQLQQLASALADARAPHDVLALGQTTLNEAFEGPCELRSTHDRPEPAGQDFAAVQVSDGLRQCMVEGAVLGPGTGRWPGLNAWFIPLGHKDQNLGAACIRPARAADTQGREHAQAICALLGQALLRLQMNQHLLQAQEDAQRQHLQNTFLAAISHDLRTPLAAIVGTATAMQTQGDRLSPAQQDQLLKSLVRESSYLSDITENTLQLMKLSNDSQGIQRSWESIEEIIGAVLARVRQHDPARRIRCSVPKGLPLLQADPVLLSQLLGNLLDNALKYSDGTIDLSVRCAEQAMIVSVKDRGNGIPDAQKSLVFQPYARTDQTGRRGVGLGLALAQAIATAHGGSLGLKTRQGGGSHFFVRLPVDPQPSLETP